MANALFILYCITLWIYIFCSIQVVINAYKHPHFSNKFIMPSLFIAMIWLSITILFLLCGFLGV